MITCDNCGNWIDPSEAREDELTGCILCEGCYNNIEGVEQD